MKQLNLFKTFLFAALLSTASAGVQAQNYHPLAFGTGGVYAEPNYYADYVGLNVTVPAPASVAGTYIYTYAWTGATGTWGGAVGSPAIGELINDTLKVGPPSNLTGCGGFSAGYFTDRIALLWRGPISGACDFSVKAYNAQSAGALAVVLINEYPGEGPVAMASGTDGSSVTIPVFQIGNIPGTALDSACNDGIVTMTITTWGVNLANNLGFVPGGTAFEHDFAVPFDQLTGSTPSEYMGLDGAFVANYGTKTEHGVKVAATLTSFGSTTVLNTDTTEVLDSFPTIDSIWAMFVPSLYSLPTASGAGEYTLTYSIISDSTNDVPADATITTNFWASDSVYSKGSYDMVDAKPLYTDATGAANSAGSAVDFTWGNMYHVNNSGDTISAAQFSLNNGFTGLFSNSSQVNVLVFQWNDIAPADGIVETGELNIVALAQYTFNGTTDSSSTVLKTNPLGQLGGFTDSTGFYSGGIPLSANSSYYVAVSIANGTGWTIYYDGQIDPYPRTYGRFMKDSTMDYSNIDIPGDYDLPGFSGAGTPGSFVDGTGTPYDPLQEWAPLSFFDASYVNAIDSFDYNSQKGLIPAIALITTKTPPPFTGVKNVANAAKVLNVFPIPTSDNLTVSLNLTQMSPTVTYTILDGLARVVSSQTHNNVLSEQFNIPTANLPAGNYFLIVNANGTAMSRKFVVLK